MTIDSKYSWQIPNEKLFDLFWMTYVAQHLIWWYYGTVKNHYLVLCVWYIFIIHHINFCRRIKKDFWITCCIFAHVTTDVTTMKSVGIANPNTQIVNTYDIFIFSECQSGVHLIRICSKDFWLSIMPLLGTFSLRI